MKLNVSLSGDPSTRTVLDACLAVIGLDDGAGGASAEHSAVGLNMSVQTAQAEEPLVSRLSDAQATSLLRCLALQVRSPSARYPPSPSARPLASLYSRSLHRLLGLQHTSELLLDVPFLLMFVVPIPSLQP